MTSPDEPFNTSSLRWSIAGLLFAATVINYVDRQTLSVLAPVITKQLHITDLAYARILQAFLIAYTVMYLVSGWLTDRWGTRRALAIFMAWWSASNALHFFARSSFSLGAFRMLLGLGEPGNFMAANRAVSEWFPPRERALANGFVNAGAAVGATIAAPVIVVFAARYGWQWSFVFTGALALIWIPLWLVIFRRAAPSNTKLVRPKTPWKQLLTMRTTWALFLPRFFSDPVWWFYLFWLPKFLVEQQHLTMRQMGALAWLPYLTADIGSVVGGLVSGRLITRGWEPVRARRAVMIPSALAMPVSICVAFTNRSGWILVFVSLATFFHMMWRTNLATVTNDVYPIPVLGSISGILAFGNGLGAAIFTEIVGQMVTHFSYNSVFVLMGLLHPTALLAFLLLMPKASMVRKEA